MEVILAGNTHGKIWSDIYENYSEYLTFGEELLVDAGFEGSSANWITTPLKAG